MAKAKKTTPGDAALPSKSGGKAKAAPMAAPLVDTTLAAQAAAKQLVAGVAPPLAGAGGGKESASFKQLKQSLSHTAGTGLDSLLDKTAQPGSRRPNQPFTGNRSVGAGGRNQTFGADVNRTGVPRRTSGG